MLEEISFFEFVPLPQKANSFGVVPMLQTQLVQSAQMLMLYKVIIVVSITTFPL